MTFSTTKHMLWVLQRTVSIRLLLSNQRASDGSFEQLPHTWMLKIVAFYPHFLFARAMELI